jgi:hypothetical protein
MLAGWTTNGYLPVLIGVVVAYVVTEMCFGLRVWLASLRKR